MSTPTEETGFAPISLPVRIEVGETRSLDVRFPRPKVGRLEGRIRAPSGQRLEGMVFLEGAAPFLPGPSRAHHGNVSTALDGTRCEARMLLDKGRFSIEGLDPKQSCSLIVQVLGYDRVRFDDLTPSRGLDLELPRGPWVRVEVRLPDGRPADRCRIDLLGRTWKRSGHTDDQGICRLHPGQGPAQLVILRQDMTPVRLAIDGAPGSHPVTLQRKPARVVLRGRVVDETGAPVPRAKVYSYDKSTWSDGGGAFTLETYPGTFVSAHAVGKAFAWQDLPRQPGLVLLQLTRGARVTGRITGDSGRVRSIEARRPGQKIGNTFAYPQLGQYFDLGRLPAGEWDIILFAHRRELARQRVRVEAGVDLRVELAPGD